MTTEDTISWPDQSCNSQTHFSDVLLLQKRNTTWHKAEFKESHSPGHKETGRLQPCSVIAHDKFATGGGISCDHTSLWGETDLTNISFCATTIRLPSTIIKLNSRTNSRQGPENKPRSSSTTELRRVPRLIVSATTRDQPYSSFW